MLFTKRKDQTVADDWELYEKGKEYHRALGLYEKASTNERFYKGDQWQGVAASNLPTPVFNVFKRVVDYYVSNILSDSATMRYSFESPLFKADTTKAQQLCNAVADYRWEKDKINSLLADALREAALTGDAVA